MSKYINYYNESINKNNKFNTSYNLEPAEVIDIILTSLHPFYKTPSDIGKIKFRRLYSDFKKHESQLSFAHILNSHIKCYPVKHEIVRIFQSLTPLGGIVDKNVGYYYEVVTNVWNYANHNALPFSTQNINDELNPSTSEFTGNTNKQSKDTEISLGDYFNEKIDLPLIMPFEGDMIFQGRFGNSLRFGATIESESNNNWSTDNTNSEIGDPIIIFRNDKNIFNDKYIVEDINSDKASIYITSTQNVDLIKSSEKNDTFIKSYSPLNQNEYSDSQIILNSDRINLNATTDSIIVTATESIWLSSNTSINIESEEYVILDSDKIYLGKLSSNEKEPVLLGTQTLDMVIGLIDTLLKATYPTPVGPTGPMLPPSQTELLKLKAKLKAEKFILSKKSFVE